MFRDCKQTKYRRYDSMSSPPRPDGPFVEDATGFTPEDGIDPSAIRSRGSPQQQELQSALSKALPDWVCKVCIVVLLGLEASQSL